MSQQNNDWQQQPQQPQQPDPQQVVPPAPAGWQGANPASGQPGAFYGEPQPGASWQQGYGYGYAAPGWAPANAQPVQQKKSRGWIVALVAVILVFVLIAMGMHSCTQAMSSSMGLVGGTQSEAALLTQDAVAVIDVSGTIQYDGTTASPEGLKEALDEAEGNSHVRAVVLRVDSGGGVATAGEEMATYVRDFSKPVVVSSASMNASAAYELSSQADYIFTAKTSAIGAIGTVLQITDSSELMDKLGIDIENITSTDSKDSSYGTRPLTDEERAYYQAMVDQINEAFIENVAEGRGMDTDEVRALATGMTFTGIDAVENGLADEIGTREDAIAKAAELAGIARYDVVSIGGEADDLGSIMDLLSESGASVEDLAEALKGGEGNGTLAR